ncbi:ABC transporter substrate-binding protein [Spirochaetia bacterium]|nr:ABC transporter substrate-binding protein [Spirochaetia bacterium]GHV86747.1 ABC transporter substrate-binding protein [Spirochaetia bacterium]
MTTKRFSLTVLFVCAAVFAGLIFSACGNKQPAASSGGTSSGPVTLVIGMKTSQFITDFENNYLTKYLENQFNYSLDFYMLPSDGNETRTKIALLVASNELPDIVIPNGDLTGEAILDYGTQNAFLPLEKYYNDPSIASNFAKLPAEDKTLILNSMTSADGHMYSLPRFEPEVWNFTPHRYYINKAWLDKLGLKAPSTTAELKDVLIAFRDRDPNGNGRKDEIGAAGFFDGGYGENITAAFINSFIFYNRNQLSLDSSGRTVTAPFTDPAFRRALVYMNDLYKEGLFSASTFTTNQQEFRALLNTQPSVVGLATLGSHTGTWPTAVKDGFSSIDYNPNFAEMDIIPPLKGPDGIAYTPYQDYVPTAAAQISAKTKFPEQAFKLMESFLDPEIGLIARYGEENVDWSRKPEDIAKSNPNPWVVMGVFPAITRVGLPDRNTWSAPNAQIWRNQNPRYANIEMGATGGTIPVPGAPPYNPDSLANRLHPYNYLNYASNHPQYVLPALQYTVEEAAKIAETVTNINDYVQQSTAEFATGVRDINNDGQWNAYLRELDNIGLKQWVSTAQTVYDRQRSR